jgi:hypothetical protein
MARPSTVGRFPFQLVGIGLAGIGCRRRIQAEVV